MKGKKVLKVLLWTVVGLFGLLMLALVTLPVWLGPTVKGVANSLAPKYTGCDFNLEQVSLNPFTGRFLLRECHLKNPKGYKSDEAFAFSTVLVEVAVGTLFTDEIHVKNIEVGGLRASYLSDGDGVNNFDRIVAKATGKEPGAKPTEEELAAKKAEEEKAAAEKKLAEAEGGKGGSGKKVVIDHFALTDSKVSLGLPRGVGVIPIPLPSVTLNDIGKDKEGGTSLKDAWNAICQGCLKAAGITGDGLAGLGNLVGGGAEGLKNLAGEGAEGLKNLVGGGAEGLKNLVGGGEGGTKVGEAADKAVGAVGDAAGKAAESLGNLFKKK